ncbi:MAG: M23 family metallopeptidase [Gemmatimonadaceae bacterium]
MSRVALLVCCALLLAPLAAGRAQDARIRQQREELERIRRERSELERQMEALRNTVHELSDEVTLLDRRAEATARIVRALDEQLVAITVEMDSTSSRMSRAEADLARKRVILRRRLVDIYKRGPLYTAEALLSAQSFGELVGRYKYLHLVALRDRALVTQMEELRNQIARQRDRLVVLRRSLSDRREERQLEEERLRSLEQQQRQQLSLTRREQQQTSTRLASIRRSETQLSNAIAAFEEERRRAEAARPAAARAVSSIRASEYGTLEWPVTGPLIYTFGREVQANNTAIRWNGIGIRAAEGAEVRSVAAGRVASVRQVGTYGLTVILEHGGGDYSIYGSLAAASVRAGEAVTKGQVLGTVGISDPDLPAHLHFEIRHGERTEAIDPSTWLRRR